MLENNKIKYLIPILSMILFMTCDESLPSIPEDPEIEYLLSSGTSVEGCGSVPCIDGNPNNQVYANNVSSYDANQNNNLDDDYRMEFFFQLLDDNGEDVSDAEIKIKEYIMENGEYQISLGKGVVQIIEPGGGDSDEKKTNSEGIMEGYWKDDNEPGNYRIISDYTDEFNNTVADTIDITVLDISAEINDISVYAEFDILYIDSGENAVQQDSVFAIVKDANSAPLPNCNVIFELTSGAGSLYAPPEGSVTNSQGKAYAIFSNDAGIEGIAEIKGTAVNSNTQEEISNNGQIIVTTATGLEYEVATLEVNLSPDEIILITQDNDPDSTYAVEIEARVRDDNGIAVPLVPIYFENNNPEYGQLVTNLVNSNNSGLALDTLFLNEDEVEISAEIGITAYIIDPEDVNTTLIQATNTISVVTDAYTEVADVGELNTWAVTNEEFENNSSTSFQTELWAEVLNNDGGVMPGIEINFSKITEGVGSLSHTSVETDSLTGQASSIFTTNPNTFPEGVSQVNVEFEISIANSNEVETLEITYIIEGSPEPELDVSEFHFYPNYEGVGHSLYTETPISVIAKNSAGVGVSNVLVRFELTEQRDSNGEISTGSTYTCCTEPDAGADAGGETDDGGETDGGSDGGSDGGNTGGSSGQAGVAEISYTNIWGGTDILRAYILHPYTSEVLHEDEITIASNASCPDCEEELSLISQYYFLPDENTDDENSLILAFYTDSLGNPPEVNSFINFEAIQPNDEGDWVNIGSITSSSFFESKTVGDYPNIFPNPNNSDSTIITAEAIFNKESSSGLARIVGTYAGITDTLGILLSSTDISSVEILPPYPSNIAVQGSPDQEFTNVQVELKDGLGQYVSEQYMVRYTLTDPGNILSGVHLDGNPGVTDTWTYSNESGLAQMTLNSGISPGSISIWVRVYEMQESEIGSVEELNSLEVVAEAQGTPVTVSTGPPTSGVIGYSFLEAVNIGGGLTEMPVSIMLWDSWSNPVADCTSVYFTLNPATSGSIIAEAKTGNIKPNSGEDEAWPGVAWTTIQYNASQLFEFPEIIATTTGHVCLDENGDIAMIDLNGDGLDDVVVDPDTCEEQGFTWTTNIPISFSSLENIVSYQNVCVDCTLTLVALSDTQQDFQCNPNAADWPIDLRAQLLDAYGVPVEGAIVELLITGSQGAPVIEAVQYVCQDAVGNEIDATQEECEESPFLTWTPVYYPEPPSTAVFTDEFGLKYWRVTFSPDECILASQDPDSYTCSSPSIQANLVNPNGAVSTPALNIIINSTCAE